MTSSPDPSVFGQAVTFTATVTAVAPGAGTPTGTVTFAQSGGGTVTVPLDASGVASVTSAQLPAGTYSGIATYNGDPNFSTSSGTDTHTVDPADTVTTVNSAPDPTVVGQTATFTATVAAVAPGTGTPYRYGHLHRRRHDSYRDARRGDGVGEHQLPGSGDAFGDGHLQRGR
nr:Ig-like domain-containing protein [Streptomyces marispadix]